MDIPQSAREFIEAGRLAHLVTINKDGSPQVSVVWAGLEGDELFVVHPGGYPYQKLKNIARDARVSLSMEGEGFGDHGETPYIVVHGTARVEDGDIIPLLRRLSAMYLGEPDALTHTIDGPGHITRITPSRIGGLGPWMETT